MPVYLLLPYKLGFFVEQQGIEPWSKHGIHMLSTCLAFCWFSNIARKKAPKLYLSFCYFTNATKQNVD